MSNEIPTTQVQVPQGKEVATIAGGCFWCVEAVFTELKGVDKVVSGYSGGKVANPSYEAVCSGTTDHAEAVQITFDPKVIAYRDLLRIFFTTHDPTTLNRQGHDAGTQYRSAIFYHSPEQRKVADEVIKEITTEKLYKDPIVTEVTPFKNFYAAETYHQDYYAQNPNQGYCMVVIAPKVRKFREKYYNLLKK
jgi:peptide-methionine (S)-S-oxide reductase